MSFIMIKSAWARRALIASAALAPLLMAGAAAAADATTSAPAAATAVGEIVVTATRREESLSKVPESVSAFTAAKMDIQGIKSFADVAKFTPGVTFDQDSHDISIRGIESTAGSGTTGIYIDDTPIQMRNLGLNANNTLPAVFDLNRVEVLRGPQGTLFGAGSEGGTVRYITNQPSLTKFSALAHAELAFTQDGAPSYEAGVAAGGPIIDEKLGFRVSAWVRRDGGWIDRVNYLTLQPTDKNANRVDTYVLRAALTWAPIANLTITPGVDYQKRDQHNHDEYWVGISDPSAGVYLSGTPDRQADPDRFIMPTLKVEWDAGPVKVISNTSYFDRREHVGGYSATIYNLSYFQHFLSADPSVSTYGYPSDPNGNPCANNCQSFYPLLTATGLNLPGMPNYYSWNTITNTQQDFTQEFRLQSGNPASHLQWVAGFFYSHNTQRSTEEIHDPQLPALTQLLWNEDMITAWGENLLPNGDDYINDTGAHDRQTALFADATFSVTEQLKVTAGVRYAWTHFDFHNLNDGPQDLLDNGGVPATVSGGKDEKPFTPKLSVSWQVTPDDLVYATAAKGYRIGGATPPLPIPACGPNPFPTSYNSDSVWSYEAGTKDRFFDRTLQVSASAYYIKWSNIQQAFYVPLCGIQFTTNAGAAVSKGFDLQAQWLVTHGLDLEMSVGYTHARFTQTALDNNGDVLNVVGDSLDVAPWTVTLGAQYDFKFFDRDAFIRGDYEYRSKRTAPIPNEDPNTAFFDPGLVPDPATNEVSARAGMTIGSWDVALFANNLFNAHPQLSLQHQDSSTLLYEATTFRPRTVGIAASFRY
jgi:outer membrane receptor protein involved in Fe transport